ncbi:ATP-binding protein [Nonomuraea sp. NPDC048892]|uniref:ATP-binding protein n=1 Tax=Nonomuraea sp. NPDC048892 TaxID=3154624 RepID=UPI0033F1D9E7
MGGRPRGRLRVHLGVAPGVGKTYAMLSEARRARERGEDVVVGLVETHGRAATARLLDGLEVLPLRTLPYRGTTFTELNVGAVIARAPAIVLIDELAHTNVPGSRNAKRWQDVAEILDAGIDVVSAVGVQHLASLNDAVERITGVRQRETVPDEVLRRADRIELVDLPPETLLRRLAHGGLYPADQVDAALAGHFRLGNLTALRELAQRWLAADSRLGLDQDERLGLDRDGGPDDERPRLDRDERLCLDRDGRTDGERPGFPGARSWEARERVVVALTGGPEGDTLVRRAARIAARGKNVDLLAVHVTNADGPPGGDPATLVRQRALVETLGGTYHQVVGEDVPRALLEFARGVRATQLVLGASRRRWPFARGVGATTSALSGPIDVHIVPHEATGLGRGLARPGPALTRTRRLSGWALALLGMPLLAAVLVPLGLSLPSELLLFLLLVVAAAMAGGMWPALTAAVFAFGLLNWFFTPPVRTLTVARPENVLALVIFVLVAVMVSTVVDLAARRSREAARSRADAEVLSTLAGHVLRGESALPSLLARTRETFGLSAVTLLERSDESGEWRVVATSGGMPATRPGSADTDVAVDDRLVLAARGRPLEVNERKVLEAFGAQAAVALRQQRLREVADRAGPLAEVDRMRTALLAAVGHDLRTPLASARAAVESLRSTDVTWTEEDRGELLATADESLIKLNRLVSNLLDMSRLQAGALGVRLEPVAIEDVLPHAVDDLGPLRDRLETDIPSDLPEISADPALLERVLVNLITNAVRHNPGGEPVRVTAGSHGGDVEIHVIDRGPGIPAEAHERVFLPFQRLGDRDNHAGVGLGLALSRGLTEAMGGTLTPQDTPGGGLTMTISLRRAS